MPILRWFFVVISIGLLAACSSPHTPAPVSAAGTYTQDNRGELKSSQYVVKRGDTLYSIAWRAGLDHKTLAKRNNIASPYTIFVGQKLSLSAAAKSSSFSQKTNTTRSNSSSSANKKSTKKLESSSSKAYAKNSPAAAKTTRKSGKITWRWPTNGKIIKGFSNAQGGNKGIDISGRQGQKIVASANGTVVYAGSALRGYGKLIIIKHDDDYLSAYAHNSLLRVKEKQHITAGQHIADMGDTGTTDTRLHFEIRYKGKSVDPKRYLPAR